MKVPAVFVFACLFMPVMVSAQGRQSVEADLNKAYWKIDYWDQRKNDTTVQAFDSVEKANDLFSKKLAWYTNKYAFTINYPFKSFAGPRNVNIVTSTDGLFRIYSWDTETGGTMHDFENVLQYKSGNVVHSIRDRDTATVYHDTYYYHYSHLYTVKASGKTYYLGVYYGIFSSKDRELGIKAFSIENGKINDKVKLFKTPSGMNNIISCDYDLFTTTDKIGEPDILFDPVKKIIGIPVIVDNDAVTKRHIWYRFNGQYFERVKK
jgi:hypothetical protein